MMEIIVLMGLGAVLLALLFTLTWVVQLRNGNAAIVDVVWPASFPLLTMLYFVLINGYVPRQLLVLGVVCLWGFRLSGYLYARNVGKPEDARYTALRQQWGSRHQVRMLGFYLVQAFFALMLSLPFVLTMVNTTPVLVVYEWLGLLIGVAGVAGEAVADAQLARFKSEAANRGKLCEVGLWNYSRHPNYFFEWLTWVGFSVMALGSAWGYLGIISPIIMYYVLTQVTGIGYTEAHMRQTRGADFIRYQQTTSAFFPWFKKQAA